jgi:hypothetical protein
MISQVSLSTIIRKFYHYVIKLMIKIEKKMIYKMYFSRWVPYVEHLKFMKKQKVIIKDAVKLE